MNFFRSLSYRIRSRQMEPGLDKLSRLIESNAEATMEAMKRVLRDPQVNLSRLCFVLTIGSYKKPELYGPFLEVFEIKTNAKSGHGRECQYSPILWNPYAGSHYLTFAINRDAFLEKHPIIGYADDDGTELDDLELSGGIRYLRSEPIKTGHPGRLRGNGVSKRHFFEISPDGSPPTLTKLSGGEFDLEFSWLSDETLTVIHEDDFCCK